VRFFASCTKITKRFLAVNVFDVSMGRTYEEGNAGYYCNSVQIAQFICPGFLVMSKPANFVRLLLVIKRREMSFLLNLILSLAFIDDFRL